MNEKIKKQIEKEFLKIRGWRNWEEYDRIGENSELDKNIRSELINTSIKECQKEQNKKVKELKNWINNENGNEKYFMSLGIDKLNEEIKNIFVIEAKGVRE